MGRKSIIDSIETNTGRTPHGNTIRSLNNISYITKEHAEPRTPQANQNKARNGLTAKQERFAQLVSEGNTLADSFRQAYDASSMKPSTVYTRASQLMRNAKVAYRINTLLQCTEQDAQQNAARLRLFLIERLQIEALQAKTDSARIKALELIGKLDVVQAFNDLPTDNNKEQSADSIRKQIMARLSKLVTSDNQPTENRDGPVTDSYSTTTNEE